MDNNITHITEDIDFGIEADDAEFALAAPPSDDEPDFSEFEGSEVNILIDGLSSTAQGKFKSLIQRLERLHEDRQAVMNDIKEVMSEAKGEGFDVKIIRLVLKIRVMDRAKKQEQDALVELYLTALEDFVAD